MKDANCIGTTEERADGWFCVVCSVHGDIFAYNRDTVASRGEKEVQAKINEAWERHEPLLNQINEVPNLPFQAPWALWN